MCFQGGTAILSHNIRHQSLSDGVPHPRRTEALAWPTLWSENSRYALPLLFYKWPFQVHALVMSFPFFSVLLSVSWVPCPNLFAFLPSHRPICNYFNFFVFLVAHFIVFLTFLSPFWSLHAATALFKVCIFYAPLFPPPPPTPARIASWSTLSYFLHCFPRAAGFFGIYFETLINLHQPLN
jgi:hypothetical protein